MSKPVQLPSPKPCTTCGKVHAEIPTDHKEVTDPDYFMGYYWNCACGSTMFVALGKIVKAVAARKTVMKDYSKRKDKRYAVQDSAAGGPFGMPVGWYSSLKEALRHHPDAEPAQGCLKPDGTRKVLK